MHHEVDAAHLWLLLSYRPMLVCSIEIDHRLFLPFSEDAWLADDAASDFRLPILPPPPQVCSVTVRQACRR